MRRCYAHVPAAENPLRPEAPKSPWSRRIVFPAPSGHFRIALFLIGCLCLFFLVVVPSIGSFSFSIRLPFPMVSFFGYWGAFCVPSGFDGRLFRFRPRFLRSGSSFASLRLDGALKGFFVCSPLGVVFRFSSFLLALRSLRQVVRSSFSVFSDGSCLSSVFLSPSSRFSSSLFPSFFPMVSVFSLIPFKALFLFVFVPFFRLFALGSTSFPFPAFPSSSFFLFPSFSLAWLACSFPFRGFRLRSGRFVFVLRFRLSASPRRNAPSGGGVGPIGQGCPRVRGRPPRGWRGGAGPGSRTRAAMGGRGRRRRGGRRPMGSAGRRTRRRR